MTTVGLRLNSAAADNALAAARSLIPDHDCEAVMTEPWPTRRHGRGPCRGGPRGGEVRRAAGASRYEDLADDLRGPAERAQWERIAALLAEASAGTVYDPDVDDVVQAELAADAVPAAAREAELREAVRIAARANHLQVLRDLGTLGQAEPADGDEVDAWLAHALAAHLGHYRGPAAREAAAGLLTPPVLAHAALLGELLRLVPGADADELAFAAGLAATEPQAVGALATLLTRARPEAP
ncbi:hypothetical protein ACIQWN_32995 [Streptomyces vinaceus]|uniref:hypothetical protein n=1 Tax=Streptomyces vinaceus TaxID=1960 RepID=UPI003806D92F